MPGYFVDNEIAATYLASDPGETVPSGPPARAGAINEPSSSSAAMAGNGGGTGLTRGTTIAAPVSQTPHRSLPSSSPLRSEAVRGNFGQFSDSSNMGVTTHINNPVHAQRGHARGGFGRGGYRGRSTAYGRPIDISPAGSGPRPPRDEDWQPNMEPGAAMPDAPPEIRSVSDVPLSRPSDGLSAGVSRGRGGRWVMPYPRGRGKSGRGRAASGHPFSRPLVHPPEKHPSSPFVTSALKRKGFHETFTTSQEKPLTNKQKKRMARRTLREEEAQNFSQNGTFQARNAYENVSVDRNASTEPRENSSDTRQKENRKREVTSDAQPLEPVNVPHSVSLSTNDAQLGNAETRTNSATFGPKPDSISMQIDEVNVDDVSCIPPAEDEGQVPGSSTTDHRNRPAFQNIDKGKATMYAVPEQRGLSPLRLQIAPEYQISPKSTDNLQLDVPTEAGRDTGEELMAGSSSPPGKSNTFSSTSLTRGNGLGKSITTRTRVASQRQKPTYLDEDFMMDRPVPFAPDNTANIGERQESDSARINLPHPLPPRNVNQDKEETSQKKCVSRRRIRITTPPDTSRLSTPDPMAGTHTDTVKVGGDGSLASGLQAAPNGTSSSNDKVASISLPLCLSVAQISSGLNSQDVTKTNTAAEKEEGTINDPEIIDVDKIPRTSGTISFP